MSNNNNKDQNVKNMKNFVLWSCKKFVSPYMETKEDQKTSIPMDVFKHQVEQFIEVYLNLLYFGGLGKDKNEEIKMILIGGKDVLKCCEEKERDGEEFFRFGGVKGDEDDEKGEEEEEGYEHQDTRLQR